MKKWMIYGANGYSGRLIVEECLKKGLKPILAGRNRESIIALAEKHDLPFRVFSIDDQDTALEEIADISALLNCAGPYSKTCSATLELCLNGQIHYLDISGEIDSFEYVFSMGDKIEKSNSVVIPGVGFDVVPTDCLAGLLKAEMPDADSLTLAFHPQGGLSPGTTKTMIEGLPGGSKIRRHGKIESSHLLSVQKLIIGNRTYYGVCIPWGDISTAYQSTGIENIRVLLAGDAGSSRRLRTLFRYGSAFKSQLAQKICKKFIESFVSGPSTNDLEQTKAFVWGEVQNKQGRSFAMGLKTNNPYRFTAEAAVLSVETLLQKELKPGAYSPAMAFGPQFIDNFSQVSRI